MLELSAETRAANLTAMADRTFDVLVIGGGITGAGVALDAAARGLSVALVEREDFAAGTSGRSSRLVHGGARYLQQGRLGLVYEQLRERNTLLRLAPHLVRPLPFLVPTRRLRQRVPLRFGLGLYGALATGRGIAPHRQVDENEAAAMAPGMSRPSPGLVYWDCHTDDARLTIEVVRQAAALGAAVANHAEVEGLWGDDPVRGAVVTDRLTGGRLEVGARIAVNATGVWADRIQRLADVSSARLRPSKGVHLVFDRHRVEIHSAVMVPSVAGDGAFVFLIPWGPRVFAGTTDTPYRGPLEDPHVESVDAEIILRSVSRAFGELSPADVVASWAGIRPLLDTGSRATRDLSRRHIIRHEPPGLITVTGGKLTTYRAMAEEVVDAVCRALSSGGACRTADLPLGLTGPLVASVKRAEMAARSLGLPADAGRRLVQRYGDDWQETIAMIRDDPRLGEEAVPGLPVLRVELAMARTREMAITDEDVLIRRTRLAPMGVPVSAALAAGRRRAGFRSSRRARRAAR